MPVTLEHPLKFVIVEDSPDLLDSWEEILSLDGHEVHGYTHGHEALRHRDVIMDCDVLVCDFYLPDINGGDLVQRVRGQRNDLPVIFLTGSKEQAVSERMNKVANAVVLYKPLRIEQFEQAVADLLRAA